MSAAQVLPPPARKRIFTAAGLVVLLLAVFAGIAYTFRRPGNLAGRDFFCYWVSAKLLLAHANPYDGQAIFKIESAAGATYHIPFIMRNPPWALPLIAPLALLNPVICGTLWFAGIIVAALASIRMICPGKIRLVAYLFAPIVACNMTGQITAFLLLAIVAFFRFHKAKPFSSGLLAVVLAIKPHLFLLLWPILLIECCRRREFRALAGAATAMIVTTAVALWFDPHVWTHYRAAMSAQDIQDQLLPNLPCLLRVFAPRQLWLQALPAGLGMLWAARYYWQRRAAWSWVEHGPLLLFVSALVSPYSWPCDQVLLLPAILQILERQSSRLPMRLSLVLNAGMLLMLLKSVPLGSPMYLWVAPAWLAWLLISRRQRLETTPLPVPAIEAQVTNT